MSDDYLWDRTGPTDLEIRGLEDLLSNYRTPPRRTKVRTSFRRALTIAAIAILVFGVTLIVRKPHPASEWSITGKRTLVGQTVVARGEAVKIEAEDIGEVVLQPNSQIEVLRSADGVRQLSLQRGTLHATIWAPPSRFVVQTPSAATIDLGCSYTLSVTDDGASSVSVQTGWVAFRNSKGESFIPSGAVCRTQPRQGPGLPYWENSSTKFRNAVERYSKPGQHRLEEILDSATQRDALTLWHLIRRTSGPERDQVIAKFVQFVPTADYRFLQAGSPKALDEAWDLLELGAAGLFRTFEGRWSN